MDIKFPYQSWEQELSTNNFPVPAPKDIVKQLHSLHNASALTTLAKVWVYGIVECAHGGIRLDFSASPADGSLQYETASLINRIKAGETELFCELIQPYIAAVNGICHSILRNKPDTEDAAQNTLLKAFTHIGELRAEQSFKTWLLQIAINEARMRIRKDRKHLFDSLSEEIPETEEDNFKPRRFAAWRDIPLQELECKQIRDALGRALMSLDYKYRDVILLRDVQQLSVSQVAGILGISECAVTSRLHRARLQMREELAPLFGKPGTGSMSMSMVVNMGKRYLRRIVNCKTVVRQLSNYVDGEIDPHLRASIIEHLKLCQRCSVLLDSTYKLLKIIGDGRVFEVSEEQNSQLYRIVCGQVLRKS